MLDEIDQNILHQIQQDSRKRITDIAANTSVSDNTVRNRLMSLHESGVISDYTANISFDKAGIEQHSLFICTSPLADREELAEEVGSLEQTIEVTTLMSGKNNVLIRAVRKDKDEITEFAIQLETLGLDVVEEEVVRSHNEHPYVEFSKHHQE